MIHLVSNGERLLVTSTQRRFRAFMDSQQSVVTVSGICSFNERNGINLQKVKI